MCLGKDTGNETFNFKDLVLKNSKEQTILGVTIKVTLRIYVRKPHKNKCFIKALKSPKWFSEKISS